MQRRIIRLTTEDSISYLDIEEFPQALAFVSREGDKKISLLYSIPEIEDLLRAIAMLKPEK